MKKILIKNETEVISMENNLPKPVGPAEVMYSGHIIEVIHQKMQIGDKTETK